MLQRTWEYIFSFWINVFTTITWLFVCVCVGTNTYIMEYSAIIVQWSQYLQNSKCPRAIGVTVLALTVIPDFLYEMTQERLMDLPQESCPSLEPAGGAHHISLSALYVDPFSSQHGVWPLSTYMEWFPNSNTFIHDFDLQHCVLPLSILNFMLWFKWTKQIFQTLLQVKPIYKTNLIKPSIKNLAE